MAQHSRAPSASFGQPIPGFRSRRGSLSSLNSPHTLDRETLSNALDEIHTNASRSHALTSFSDFDGRSSSGRGSGTKDFVSSGFSGLYSRLRQSVGAGSSPTSDSFGRPSSRSSLGYAETASVRSVGSGALRNSQVVDDGKSRGVTTSTSSPTTVPRGHGHGHSSHVSRSSLNLASTEASSFADSSVFDEAEDYGFAPLPRPAQKVHSRPGSRDLANTLATLQSGPGSYSQADWKDVSNRSSLHAGPFRDDGTVLADDHASGLISLMPGTDAMQMPLERVSSQTANIMERDPRRRSQNIDQAFNPAKSAVSSPVLQPSPGLAVEGLVDRPPLRSIGPSHLPGLRVSLPSSVDVSAVTSRKSTPMATPTNDIYPNPNPNPNSGFQPRRSLSKASSNNSGPVAPQWRRRVLSKEFWMKDENAKDCFHCGDPFSTFRRKHHCRTCGQIFCSRCTILCAGKDFGQAGRLRLCRPCEAMVYGSDDDSSAVTDEEAPAPLATEDDSVRFVPEMASIGAPSIGIPVNRRNRDVKRRSAVIEFDQPMLARPSSSRSLKSMTGRPRSAGHRRRHSRQQSLRPLKYTPEERGPFYQDVTGQNTSATLTALDNDAFIDPDLADYMSDEYSEDEQPNIFATLSDYLPLTSPIDGNDRVGMGSLLASASKKGRSRRGDRSIAGQSLGRDSDGMYLASRHAGRLNRRRNASVSSFVHGRPSPRRSRSTNLLRTLEHGGFGDPGVTSPLAFENTPPLNGNESQIKCSSAMHGTNAPAVELNSASLEHVQRLLSQLLKDFKIPHGKKWQKALMPILLQCTDDVDPDVQHGDDMDIRNYIKLKKIPGGKPGDTAYVSGVIFSKNVALKDMKRKWIKPRIVIITFPIEYTRHHSSFFTLENLIAQEKEYVRMLVGRIISLRPQLLLVQRHVCGFALQLLQEAGVTVVFNIKESVLAAVARVTQTVLIKSQDKLSIDLDHLGQCGVFEVKTYVHGGRKKSYIWMSGCQPDLGCTIALRGADMETLRSIKRVTEFMSYVVYNLRLETCLMRDEFVLIPSRSSVPEATPVTQSPQKFELVAEPGDSEPVTPTPRAEQGNPMDNNPIADQTHPTVDSPAMNQNLLNHLVDASRHEAARPVIPKVEQELVHDHDHEEAAMPSQYRELIDTARNRLISSSPFVKFTEPYLLVKAQEQERKVEQSKRLRDRYDASLEANRTKRKEQGIQSATQGDLGAFELVVPEMLQQAAPEEQPETVQSYLRDMHDAQFQMALREYDIKKKQWESFFSSSGNDPFNPFNHQNIWVLHSIVSSVTSVPCAGPEVFGLGFYAGFGHPDEKLEEDCTLGQFVEDLVENANTTCKNCNRKFLDHHRQYVHGTGQLSVSVKRYPSKYPGLKNSIFMWSACKICQQETTWMPMSDSTWKYSFGKYLELSFWSTPLKPRAGVCPHDIHKDFVRWFAYESMAVRVQYDPVELYDVIVPRSTITWEVTEGLVMKNELFTQMQIRLDAFMKSVKARLHHINLSTVKPELETDANAMIEKLMQRADGDHEELQAKLQAKYSCSQFWEIIPMNRALRMMDEKAIAWDDAFAEFERNYFPSENDIRRLATIQIKRILFDRTGDVADREATDASDTDDGMEMKERPNKSKMKLTDEELQSEKAQSMLTSVVEEHGHPTADVDSQAPVADPEDGKMAVPDTSALSRQLSPEEIEQAVDREDVKHLDLAVPVNVAPDNAIDIPPPTTGNEHLSLSESVNSTKTNDSFAVEPKPLNSTILERIEQMRSAAAAGGSSGSEGVPESRIPRLAGLKVRGTGPPNLARAQSQPNQIPSRSADPSADIHPLETVGSNDQSGAATPTQQNNVPNRDLAKCIEQRLADRLGTGRKAQASLIPRSVPSNKPADNSTRVSALAKHFEQLSKEFERERLRERRLRAARSRQVRANPLASSRAIVEVYTDPRFAVGEEKGDYDYDRIPLSGPDPAQEQAQQSSDGADQRSISTKDDEGDTTDHDITDTETADSTAGAQTDTEAEGDATDGDSGLPSPNRKRDRSEPHSSLSSSAVLSPASPHESDPHLDLSLPKHEKTSLMKVLTSFWSERSASGWLPLDYPLLPTEHVFDDSDIVVREDEPASVIALALSSQDYVVKVDAFRLNPGAGSKPNSSHTQKPSQGSLSFAAQMFSTSEASAQAAIEASLISPTGTHMKYSFAHGPVKTTCKIFYAESFDALRRKCGVADRFVESLSRCAKWDSKGGKTKSLFLKTLDDRFVIKSLQEVELKAFTKFAPDYFSFMSHTLFHGVPSVIAKMFGLFQVIIKNPATGTEFSSYLLVMENLFYSRNPTRRFDLKGSMRNRKIESTGQPDEVLLDENLVETIFETPLFVREHARKLLRAGVWNDTMWLCKQNVMDYSLMAGFDDEKKELVVGIIDCIRTYTWDKKLESWIKDRGKNKPTITSPKDYRNRFRVSMMQYVLQSPNVWHGFLNQVPNSVAAMKGTNGYQQTPDRADDGSMAINASRGGEMANVEGVMGRGYDGAESLIGNNANGRKIAEQRISSEGGLDEATIREMSTMTFA